MYRGTELPFFDFSGGLASNRPTTLLNPNQALYANNVFITAGKGIQQRYGNTVFNSSAMTGSGAITGLGYFKPVSGNDHLIAITGAKIFESTALDGTMNDITGAVTITSSANNIWTYTPFNNLAIFVGGAPDAPIKYSGSGNAAALGGSPISGNFGFSVNNRMFIGNTTANPSRVAWSILSNPEDYSGVGSGSTDVQVNDGDVLIGAGILSNDVVLLFKKNSVHQMLTRTSPFPVFPLFKNVGAIGKNAIVVANGICYFITPQAKMKATDGTNIIDFPEDVDDIWSGLNVSRLPFIQGFRNQGIGYDHIVWTCTTGSNSTNTLAIIWDLDNKCWLQHKSGYSGNIFALNLNGTIYMGSYDGKIYTQDVKNTNSDASETSPGMIGGIWRTGWNINGSLQHTVHPFRINIAMLAQSAGNLTVGYGFDFNTDQIVQPVIMQSPGSVWDVDKWDAATWGAQSDVIRSIFPVGRGSAFQLTFSNSSASQTFTVHGFTVSGKKSGQKVFQAA